MSCEFIYYVNKAYDIPIVVDEDRSILPLTDLINDIGTEFSVTLTLSTNNTITNTFSLDNGKIVIDPNSITIKILAGDITVPGYYKIKYDYTDNYAKERAIPPCPRRIRFYTQ